jgi:hypothetical protein
MTATWRRWQLLSILAHAPSHICPASSHGCPKPHYLAGNAKHESAQQEILALMAKTLTLRLTNLTLLRGSGSHNRVLVVEMLNTRQVYARLRGVPMPTRQDKPGFRKPKPWHHGL